MSLIHELAIPVLQLSHSHSETEYSHCSEGSDPFEERSPKAEANKFGGMIDKPLRGNLELIHIRADQIRGGRISFQSQIIHPSHYASDLNTHTHKKKETNLRHKMGFAIMIRCR